VTQIRPRETWIADVPWDHTVNGKGEFYICPPFRGWPAITDAVVHYPGADWADMDFNNDGQIDVADTATVIAQMHRMYLMGTRGYSLGYGFGVGQLGDVWEIRGWRNSNAANLGDKAHNHVGWNNYSISVLVIVDDANAANPKQVDAVNWLLDDLASRKGGKLNLLWHGQGQATGCAGAGIIGQIQSGTIGFGKSAPVVIEPPVPPTSEEDDMLAQLLRLPNGDVVVRGAGPCRRVSLGGDIEHLVQTLGNPRNLAESDPETAWVRGELAAYDAAVRPV
jgi:hypothetical protein